MTIDLKIGNLVVDECKKAVIKDSINDAILLEQLHGATRDDIKIALKSILKDMGALDEVGGITEDAQQSGAELKVGSDELE